MPTRNPSPPVNAVRHAIASALPESSADRGTLYLLTWCAFALIATEYFVLPIRTVAIVNSLQAAYANSALWASLLFRSLAPQLWWAGGMLVLWVFVPGALYGKTGGTPFSIGLPSTLRGLSVYAGMIALMIPLIVIASGRPDFLRTYPLVRPVPGYPLTWSLLCGFWVCYALILFCTEYLFRGVLLFALQPRLGNLAIAVSAIPYAMIHVHKPAPEAMGAIFAGYILGYTALVTRSIGGGVMVHCAVAISMDVLALWRKGAFPVGW